MRADNGPELIAETLRDGVRFSRIGISYIEPGSPWENPYVESFNGHVRDELLNIEEFGSLLEAQVVVEAWRIEYNTYRPTAPSAGSPPPRSAPHGPPNTNQHSHDRRIHASADRANHARASCSRRRSSGVRVFLSYSRSDRVFVDRFASDLGRAGIEVWCDVDALRGGEQWRTQIIDAIQQSDVFLLFVSPASMHSDNVRRELTVAEEEDKPIVPVLMAVTAIPDDFRYSLAGVQYTDITAMDYDDAFAAVRDALTDDSATEVPPAPPPPRDTTPAPMRRKPGRRSVIIAVAALGVLVAVIAIARGRRRRRGTPRAPRRLVTRRRPRAKRRRSA